MLSKAHLTSHSRMSGSKWVITRSWLSGSWRSFCTVLLIDFRGGSDSKASVYDAGDPDSIPGLGRYLGEGNGNPLQYSCWENPMDGGAWWATVHGVAKTWLSDFTHSLTHSAGISSAPLALFIVMFPKAHLTSHPKISGSRWVITPSWLSGSLWSFFHSSSVYSFHLFLISSASFRSILFLSFIEPIFAWNVPLLSLIFLRWSLVFPILLFLSISLPWSLRTLSYVSLLFLRILHSDGHSFPFLLYLLLLFFSQVLVQPLQTTILPFAFLFLGLFLLNLFFYWRTIALQNFVVFCQTWTWISHRYTYIPSLFYHLPISLPIPSL